MHRSRFAIRALAVGSMLILGACGGSGSGTGSQQSNSTEKIINGIEIEAASQPQVVRVNLIFDVGGALSGGICTGTVISADKVLTAAHCFEAGIPVSATIESDLVGAIPVAAYTIHPLRGVSPGNYDVAVVQTSVPHGLPAIGMRVSSQIPLASPLMISGYGLTEDGSIGTLKTGTMLVDGVDDLRIYSIFREELADTCFGDSGGPAFFTDFTPEGAVAAVGIAGITEAGTTEDCSVGETSIFTSLQNPDVVQFLQGVAPDGVYY